MNDTDTIQATSEPRNGEAGRGCAPALGSGARSKFKTIVADPPWHYGAGYPAPENRPNSNPGVPNPMPYPTMTMDEIKALPVAELADENCELYLWTTQKYLPDSFDVIKGWGFRYCGTLTWCKTPRGTGQGGLYCPTTEFIVHARRGKMPQGKPRQDSTWWNQKRTPHSVKPEYFTDMIEAVSDWPRLEMFARRQRLGWATWGNEAMNHVGLVLPNDPS